MENKQRCIAQMILFSNMLLFCIDFRLRVNKDFLICDWVESSDKQVLAKFEVIPDFTTILSGHEKRIRPDYLELF